MEIQPSWLNSMLHANFFTQKNKDKKFVEKLYFCVDCGGESLSKKEMETEHEGHKIFRPMKNSNHYCYTKDDILSLGSKVLDVSGVRVYSINSTSVYFPKPISDKHYHMKGCQGCCVTCGRYLQVSALFCSILCKLLCNESDLKLATTKSMIEQQSLVLSIPNSGNKNKNKKTNKSKSKSKKTNKKRKRDVVVQKEKSEPMKKVAKEEKLMNLVDVVEDKIAECNNAEGNNVVEDKVAECNNPEGNNVVEDKIAECNNPEGNNVVAETVEGKQDEEKKVSYRKRSRKGIPRRSIEWCLCEYPD